MPPQLEKNHVVPTSWQDEALAHDGVSREVPCSALKGETVPDSLPAKSFSQQPCKQQVLTGQNQASKITQLVHGGAKIGTQNQGLKSSFHHSPDSPTPTMA